MFSRSSQQLLAPARGLPEQGRRGGQNPLLSSSAMPMANPTISPLPSFLHLGTTPITVSHHCNVSSDPVMPPPKEQDTDLAVVPQ